MVPDYRYYYRLLFYLYLYRVYVKKMLQYVPIIGWAWKLSDVIFLERNWEKVSTYFCFSMFVICNFLFLFWVKITATVCITVFF